MCKSVFISHGPDIPMIAWSQEPDGEAVIDHYRDLLADQFELLGDDFMSGLIEITEVTEWGM